MNLTQSGRIGPRNQSLPLKRRSQRPARRAVSENVVPLAPAHRRFDEACHSLSRDGTNRGDHDGESGWRLYFREVGRVPLLTPDEETALARRIRRGDESAREWMICANLRLVVRIARDYEGYGLPLLDLINEGNIGLIRAVERFDPDKGKLSTYAAWWIKQSMRRALANQSKTIRLPVHVVDKVLKMRRASVQLNGELGRDPSDEELGEALGMKASKVAQLQSLAVRPASLEAPVGDTDGRLSDLLADENAASPYQQLEARTLLEMLNELMGTLEPREASILHYRFGLDGGGERTLEEVGRKFGVTRERIRQLQNVALAKLRSAIEEREAVRAAA